MADVPVIDLRQADAPARIDRACREHGFFSVTGHGIDPGLLEVKQRFGAAPVPQHLVVAVR